MRILGLLLGSLLLLGCTKVGGSVQRVHTITLVVGQVVQSPMVLPAQWVCTSSVTAATLTLRCQPQE